jgi:phenylacetate-CoA ligase
MLNRSLILSGARVATLKAWKNPDRTRRYLREIEGTPADVLGERCLRELLAYAGTASPFYRNRLGGASLHGTPLLSKEELRESLDAMRTPLADERRADRNISGGSTGVPTAVLQDTVYDQWGYATEEYYLRHFLGIDPQRDGKVILWGSLRDVRSQASRRRKISNWVSRTTFLNAYDAGEKQWPVFAEVIRRKRPALVRGYANALHLFSRFVTRERIELPVPKAVISSAEVLRPDMRREIEAAFGAKVFDFYGSREVGPIAGECRHGNRHLFTFNNLVEVVGADGAALPAGAHGELAVTSLHNFSAPLIRYRIGDRGALAPAGCACGSPLPILAELDGRVTDSLESREGKVIDSGFFRSLFLERPWVRQFQVTQRDYERIVVSIVGSKPSDGSQHEITAAFKRALGEQCAIEWEFVDKVELTPEGKMLSVRNRIPKGALRSSAAPNPEAL